MLYFSYYRIAKCRDAVVEKRQKVKTLSAERTKQLSDSMAWQEFCRDADEVKGVREKENVECYFFYRLIHGYTKSYKLLQMRATRTQQTLRVRCKSIKPLKPRLLQIKQEWTQFVR